MEEHHKFPVGARVKFIGVLRSEFPRPGTITILVNQYSNTVVDGDVISGVIHPATGRANPYDEPMYRVEWDGGRFPLGIHGESELVLESSIFVHIFTEDDKRVSEAQFIDSKPAVKSDIHLEGQWWEIIDLIEPSEYRFSPGVEAWKVVVRPK